MAGQSTSYELEQGDVVLPPTGRPVVHSTTGVISSGHYLTSMAGMRMMLSGGNAFDAAVAAGFAAAVVEPIASYSLAAEGVFMLYHAASGDLLSLSGQGVAPAKATAEFYKSRGLERIPTGPGSRAHFSFTVPGVVDAFISLLEKYGTKPIEEILAPAIQYAEGGIPNYEYMLERLKSPATLEQFANYPPGGADIFYENGRIPRPASLLVQPGLANTLKGMLPPVPGTSRSDGLKLARHAFYQGKIGETIVDCAQRVGGILGMEDLAGYKSQYERPVKTTFRGYEILGQNTWTQGPMLMQAINILEHFDLRSLGHNTPAYIHTVAEALKLAFADREAFYGDPDYSSIPIDGLLSKEYGTQRAALIDQSKAHPETPECGDPWRFSQNGGTPSSAATPKPTTSSTPVAPVGGGDDGGTTHVSAMDQEGNMVCGTISGGAFAKSAFFPELGCALSTRIEMFNSEEGHPNVVEPGKRPRTTLINYIISKDGQPAMTIGCPGGDNQAQANLQIVLNVLVFGMNPQEAVEAPRFASQSVVNSFYPHEYHPGRLDLEDGFPETTAEDLRSMGHKIHRAVNCGMGATVTKRDPENGILSTSGDPRRACYALAL
jgi:gamma-glutamyltranspeptidase/glutathione hydrolase